jgi:hypothetical protein
MPLIAFELLLQNHPQLLNRNKWRSPMARFKTDEVNNPLGRLKGTGYRQQLFNAHILPHKEALFETAIKLALEGNESMLKLLLERMLPPKPIDEPITFDLPKEINRAEILFQIGETTIKAVANGNLTPNEASKVGSLLNTHYNSLLLKELTHNLDIIQKRYKNSNGL